MKKRISKFSLIEILTVVAIIGILAGIGLGVTSFVANRNKEVQTQATIKILEMVLEQHKSKYGAYPALTGKPDNDLDKTVNGENRRVFKIPASRSSNEKIHVLFNDITYNSSNEITAIKGMNIVKDGTDIIILDGWESPILYVYPGVFNKTKFDLGSAGADKKIGENGTKFTKTTCPALGSRTSGAYKDHFGKADDITNFKR